MQNIYQTFEFYKIQNALLEYAKTERAKEWINELKMFSSSEKLEEALLDLKEMSSIYLRFGPLPIMTSANALKLMEMARKTALLTPHDFNLLAQDILTSQNIVKFLNKIGLNYERINKKTINFHDLDNLLIAINKIITPSLTVADNASLELKEIRQKIKKAETDLYKHIQTLSLSYNLYLSDSNATIRDGHFVLPVKTTLKSKVPGIIYDVSDSGNTTFIEPMEIVNINNLLTSLKVQENEEVRKILKALTSLVLLQEGEVIENNAIIAELDFLQSKSMYMQEIDGLVGETSNKQVIDLHLARHPLIDDKKVVPNSFYLDETKRIIVISGPNAGGKTVSLKTVGLLVLMHQCALPISANKAILGFFNNIYIDIGDNQSLSDNLSTFSAHMFQLGEITNKVKGKDLVLIDELGTGTDPKEGEALAYSITNFFESKHCLAMISSHFNALKEYAFLSPNIENSSMIFDEENLLPTYRFHLGAPGHSYALDVATRYGINENIVRGAKEFLEKEKGENTSALLDILQHKILEANKLENDLLRREKELKNKEKVLEVDTKNLKNKRDNLLEDVALEKARLIKNAKEEIDFVLKSLTKTDLKPHEIVALKHQVENLETHEELLIYNEKINVDDYVIVPSLELKGKVKKIGNKVRILTDDGINLDIEMNKLHKIDEPIKKEKKVEKRYTSIISTNVGLELNIIGLHVDEGRDKLIKYIDNCRLKHFTSVRIIHGFGSGALRKMTHDYLKTQKDISFRLGDGNEGGSGATVITFNKA